MLVSEMGCPGVTNLAKKSLSRFVCLCPEIEHPSGVEKGGFLASLFLEIYQFRILELKGNDSSSLKGDYTLLFFEKKRVYIADKF